jgi:ribosome-binding ATPase YchF (GTP1/OBG family)
MFLDSYEQESRRIDHVIQAADHLLHLSAFLTAGTDECRAWQFRSGLNAKECAGVIHTDFEKGFIKAEVLAYRDFVTYGSYNAAREAGKVRIEGKDYLFQDGDMVVFRFNG